MDAPVIKELIQDDLTTANVLEALKTITTNDAEIAEIKRNYKALWQLLGASDASANAAKAITELAIVTQPKP